MTRPGRVSISASEATGSAMIPESPESAPTANAGRCARGFSAVSRAARNAPSGFFLISCFADSRVGRRPCPRRRLRVRVDLGLHGIGNHRNDVADDARPVPHLRLSPSFGERPAPVYDLILGGEAHDSVGGVRERP